MTGQSADQHLRAVYDWLVRALYVTKQLVWGGPPSQRDALQDLLGYLIEQSHAVYEAASRTGGPSLAAPSAHERRNLLGDVGNDLGAALDVYKHRLGEAANDIRRRATEVDEEAEATLLTDIAEGLERHLANLAGIGDH